MKCFIKVLLVLLLGICLCEYSVYAQKKERLIDKEKLTKKKNAIQQIKQLKEGLLIVRLRERLKTIEAYKKAGLVKKANRVIEQQKAFNQKLMQLFKNNFDFCRIEFCYNSDSELLEERKWEGLFLNEQLEKEHNIAPTDTFFMVAEIGAVKEEVSKKNAEIYHNNTSLSRAIVLKDAHFKQLLSPFPYHIKVTVDRFLARKIRRLNGRLEKFYQKHH